MKKSIFTLAAILTLSATAFAANDEPAKAKWDTDINVYKLGKFLNLSSDQSEEVKFISEYFSEQMDRATNAKKDQAEKLHNAVYGNLKLMKQMLTPEQYTKYTRVLNVTLQNKGIEVK